MEIACENHRTNAFNGNVTTLLGTVYRYPIAGLYTQYNI